MSGDTLILAAFCVFVLLLGMRMRQRYAEWKKAGHEGRLDAKESRLRSIITILQLLVLGGLMIYMIPVLIRDFSQPIGEAGVNLFLRCLIFIFTIYILVWGLIQLSRQRNKEKLVK